MTARLGAALGLGIVYLLVLGSIDPWDAVMGLGLGAAAPLGVRRVPRGVSVGIRGRRDGRAHPLWRVVAFAPFALAVTVQIVEGTARVARLLLRGGPPPPGGVVEVPIHARSSLGVAVSALVLTLTPGTVVVDADWERRVLRIHTFDVRAVEALRASHRRLYERWQRNVFP